MDFISEFLRVTEELFSPMEFRLWAAISTVAGALERRVWTSARASRPTYPNLYVCLTGISGSGKTEAINIARRLWAQLDKFSIAPDNLSPAAFYDALAASLKAEMNGNGLNIYSAMTVCSRELGVLFPIYDRGWLSDLSDLWDNQDSWKSARRTSKSADIERPTVNILGGVTPQYLGDVMPEIAWGQGFAARILYIYSHRDPVGSGNGPPIDVLEPFCEFDFTKLENLLKSIYTLEGKFYWTPRAHSELNAWVNSGMPPVPQHSRLTEYSTRRIHHVIKLSMISAASAGHGLTVEFDDYERAMEWLLTAEKRMPDVFRSMNSKSDMQTLTDLHYHFWTKYASVKREDRKPISEKDLWGWLRDRVESHRIPGVITSAEKTGILKKGIMPDEWVPQPYDKGGVSI